MEATSFSEIQVFIHICSCTICTIICPRTLNQQYPYLATKIMYNKNLVAAREAHKLNDTHLVVLHRFTWEYDKLLLGGALLPDLVEFYQWIHTHLSHLVTYERALNITIGDVIRLSAKRYSPKLHEHLTSLYHNFSSKLLFLG